MKQEAADPKPAPKAGRFRSGPILAFLGRCALSLVLLGGSIGAVIAIGASEGAKGGKKKAKPLPAVEVAAVVAHEGGIDFDVDGVVIPFRQVDVPAEVAGQIATKEERCRIGRTVQAGDLLMTIDPEDFRLDLERLQEEKAQAVANENELDVEIAACKRQVTLATEDLEIRSRELQRYKPLAEDNPGVYSESELDAARLKELQARDALRTQEDQLEILQARETRLENARKIIEKQIEKMELDLTRTDIVAPIDGVVTQELAERGNFVQRGAAVAVVQDTSRMEIRCSLQKHEVYWLLRTRAASPDRNVYEIPETAATVSFEIGGVTYRWQGKLTYFDGAQVDKQTRMIPCRVNISAPEKFEMIGAPESSQGNPTAIALMAGMFVTVTIHATPDLDLVKLPEAAIQPGNSVWMVRQTDDAATLHQVAVRVAHGLDDAVLAYVDGDGLRAGDLVVVSPLAAPVEGGSVEIMEAP